MPKPDGKTRRWTTRTRCGGRGLEWRVLKKWQADDFKRLPAGSAR